MRTIVGQNLLERVYLVLLLAIASAPLQCLANTTANRIKSLLVTQADGKQVRAVAKYSAVVNPQTTTLGSASRPLKGKFLDTRKCSVRIESYVVREVFIVSGSGQEVPVNDLSSRFEAGHSTRAGPRQNSNFLLHGPCGDATAQVRRATAVASDSIAADLISVSSSDKQALTKLLKQRLNAVDVRTVSEAAVLQQAIDSYVASLKKASLAYKAPEKVRRGDSFEVQAVLSFDAPVEELLARLGSEQGMKSGSAAVHAGPVMEATLTGSSGLAISATGSTTRAVPSKGDVLWIWTIDAKERGDQTLTLSFSAVLDALGQPRYAIITERRTITVSVAAIESMREFVVGNWQWLWATLVVPLIPLAWRKIKKRAPEEPRRPWRYRPIRRQ